MRYSIRDLLLLTTICAIVISTTRATIPTIYTSDSDRFLIVVNASALWLSIRALFTNGLLSAQTRKQVFFAGNFFALLFLTVDTSIGITYKGPATGATILRKESFSITIWLLNLWLHGFLFGMLGRMGIKSIRTNRLLALVDCICAILLLLGWLFWMMK